VITLLLSQIMNDSMMSRNGTGIRIIIILSRNG